MDESEISDFEWFEVLVVSEWSKPGDSSKNRKLSIKRRAIVRSKAVSLKLVVLTDDGDFIVKLKAQSICQKLADSLD